LTASVAVAVAVTTLLTACGDLTVETFEVDELAEVGRVSDGDTLTLTDGRRVRLLQIDAPETGECFASAATAALTRLTPRREEVMLWRDAALDDRDVHGRLLRYIHDRAEPGPGATVNLKLVELGAAVPYFFRGERGAYADELLAAAIDARNGRRGLWGACPGARLDPNRGSLTGPA
jgi:micrococcal nuclease